MSASKYNDSGLNHFLGFTGNPGAPLPLITVVTPAYQAMPYIQDNVASVDNQAYPNIEHIVIDGASTDGTLEYLQQQPGLIWRSEPDGGQSHALNKGFRLAQGEIIGWLNADDVYLPGAVATAVRFLLEHPDIDLVYSDLQIIDQAGQVIGVSRSQPFELEPLLLGNYIKQPTVFMRRKVIDRLGGVDENLHYVMDHEFWLRAGQTGFTLHYLPGQVLAGFRLIPGTKSYEQAPRFKQEWLSVLEQILPGAHFQHLSTAQKQNLLRKASAQYHWANVISAVHRKDRKNMLHHMKLAFKVQPALMLHRGAWLVFVKGLFGLKIDRYRRFRPGG
ncbi:MAG: glycosyltransferase family 2 protein [Anaerolineaceae bacterium]